MQDTQSSDGVDLGVVHLEPVGSGDKDTSKPKSQAKKTPPTPPKKTEVAATAPDGIPLGIYRMRPSAKMPAYATPGSGCFDLEVNLDEVIDVVTGYNRFNEEITRTVKTDAEGRYVLIERGDRLLLPSGLIFDIPDNYAVVILARSSSGLKVGQNIAQGAGFIDSDYVNEVFIPTMSNAEARVKIRHGQRIAQAVVIELPRTHLMDMANPPGQKTNRKGGFGSTGK